MTLAEVYTMLTGINGFQNKVAYRAFPEKKAPKLPYICYYEEGTSNFFADNMVFPPISNVDIELYTSKKDKSSEALVEAELNKAGIPWERTETYIDSEKMYQITYFIDILEG